MFENLKKNVVKKTSTKKGGKELPRTNEFLSALKAHGLRITYAGLAGAAELLGEHTPSGLSAGQRGSQIVRALREDLQPHVCRSNGGYAKGTEWVVNGETVTGQVMKKLDFVPPGEVATYVAAFERKTEEPEIAEPEEDQLVPSDEDEIDDEIEDSID